MRYPLSFLAAILLFSCNRKESSPSETHLGVLHHQFSISEAARGSFEKGLLLLHSFEYDDAGEAFEQAIQADSSELMAYWGAVMTKYKALWGLQDLEAGRRLMEQLAPTPEERLQYADDPLEEDFWGGLEILFGEGELKERNNRFNQHMASLYEKYPDNEEVAAFYSISLLWSGGTGFDREKSLLSARIADGILKENPNHPGALHYKIHAFDHPEFAEQAQAAADIYAGVAPDATHALHMPSHIYLALGRWDDVVSSNESSYAASVARIERKNLGDDARGFHSYAWLHYGYLQQGRYEDAAKLLRDMYDFEKRASNQSARSYLITMQNAQLAEAPDWDAGLVPNFEINTDDLGIIAQAGHSFFRAHWAYKENDPETIRSVIEDLKQKISSAKTLVGDDGIAMCSAGSTRYAPNANAINLALVLQLQEEAFLALLEDDPARYEEKMTQATQLEKSCEYSFGPPDIALPSFEHYGYWLLEHGRNQEALNHFNMSLERAPRRVMAMRGKIQALKSMDNLKESEEARKELREIWSKADSEALEYIAAI